MTALPALVLDSRAKVHPASLAVCHFYIRTPAGDGQFTYEPVNLSSRGGDSCLRTAHPPLPGDLIGLYDSYRKTGGQFVVVQRAWDHASYGSMASPVLEDLPTDGPRLTVIVEASEGPFINEAPSAEDDEPGPVTP